MLRRFRRFRQFAFLLRAEAELGCRNGFLSGGRKGFSGLELFEQKISFLDRRNRSDNGLVTGVATIYQA